MECLKWHEGLVRKATPLRLDLAIAGKLMLVFAIGAFVSEQLYAYTFPVLYMGILLVAYSLIINYEAHVYKKTTTYLDQILGFIGLVFILFSLGLQSTYGVFHQYLLVIGILAMLPSIYDLFIKPESKPRIIRAKKKPKKRRR